MSTDSPWSAHSTLLHSRDSAGWKWSTKKMWSATHLAAKQRQYRLMELRQWKALVQEHRPRAHSMRRTVHGHTTAMSQRVAAFGVMWA